MTDEELKDPATHFDKMLSREEWLEVKPPFSYFRCGDRSVTEFDMLDKLTDDRIAGWWFREGQLYIFQHREDAVQVQLVAAAGFDETVGEVKAK